MYRLVNILNNIKSGELLKVTQALSQEFGEAPTAPDVWAFAARHLQREGYSELSTAIYERLFQAGCLTHEVGFNLIRNALETDQQERATELAQRLITQGNIDQNTAPEVGEMLVRALVSVDPTGALAVLDLLSLDGVNAGVMRLDALRKLDRLNEALALISGPFAELTRTDPRFLSRRARLLEQLGHWQRALADYSLLIDEFGDSHAGLAVIRILQRQERTEEMTQALSRCLTHIRDHAALLRIATQLNDPTLAEAMVARALDSVRGKDFWDPPARAMLDQCKELLVAAGYLGMAAYIERVDQQSNGSAADQTIQRILENASVRVAGMLLDPSPLSRMSPIFARDIAEQLIRQGISRPALVAPPPASTQRPKIMLVNATLAAGGAERQFLLFIESLLKAGLAADDLHICLFSLTRDRGHDHFKPWLDRLGVSYTDLSTLQVPLPSIEQASFSLLLPVTLRQDIARLQIVAQQMRPEVIHGWQDRSSLAAAWVGQENHIPQVVMSARNMQPEKRRMQLDYAAPLMKAFLSFDTVHLTANSHAGGRDYEDWLGLERGAVSVILNILNADRIPLQASAKPRRVKSGGVPPLVLGGVFRFAHNKRPLLWLEVFKGLTEQSDFPIKGILLGSGPLHAEAYEWAKNHGLNDRINWRGVRSDPAEIYQGMNALLLMSRVEGTPNVVLEAQASGLPVAACDVGGVKEAMLLDDANPVENDNLLLPASTTAQQAIECITEWWPRVCRADPAARRRAVFEAYDSVRTQQAAMGLYGLGGGET